MKFATVKMLYCLLLDAILWFTLPVNQIIQIWACFGLNQIKYVEIEYFFGYMQFWNMCQHAGICCNYNYWVSIFSIILGSVSPGSLFCNNYQKSNSRKKIFLIWSLHFRGSFIQWEKIKFTKYLFATKIKLWIKNICRFT